MSRERLRAIILALLVLIPGALAIVLTKRVIQDVPPLIFVSLQLVLGSSMISFYTFGIRNERIPTEIPWKLWLYVLLIGLSNFAISRPLFLMALERLPATTNVYLMNFAGVVTMILSAVLLRERPSAYQIGGALIALAGLRVFFRELPPPDQVEGLVFVGIGVLSLASTNIVGRRLALVNDGRLSTRQVVSVASTLGAVPVLLWTWIRHGSIELHGLGNWGVILLNAFATVVLGMTVWIAILRTLRSYEASILTSAGVIFTALFAIPILGERLEGHQLGGIALMICGLTLAQLRRSLTRARQNLSPPPPLE